MAGDTGHMASSTLGHVLLALLERRGPRKAKRAPGGLSLPAPAHFGEKALPLRIFQAKCRQPAGCRRPGTDGAAPSERVPAAAQRALPPRPRPGAPSGPARSHQQPVRAGQRALRAVGGLSARDLDVDRGGVRVAGGGGAGRQGHVLGAAAGRGRALAAQGAADGLGRVPQQVGDAAAAPAGLAPRRRGVLSVETTGGWVNGPSWRNPARPGPAEPGLSATSRLPPPAPPQHRPSPPSHGLHLLASLPLPGRGPLCGPGSSHLLDRACLHVSGQPTASSPI